MINTNFQILKTRISLVFYGGIPGLLLFVLVAFGNKLNPIQRFSIETVLICLLLITIILLIRNQKDLIAKQNIKYIDRPLPSILDFIFVIIRFASWYLILFLVTTPLTWFLGNIGLTTPAEWFSGLAVTFLWAFLFTSYSLFTTKYIVSEKILLLSSGLNKIPITISEIYATEHVNSILSTLWYDILVSQSPLIVGVRSRNMLLIKRKNDSGVTNIYFSRIYITPSNMDNFLKNLF